MTTLALNTYASLGTLSYTEVDDNWTDIEGEVNSSGKTDETNSWASAQTMNAALIEKYAALGANDIDCATGSMFSKTISGATTLTVSNVASSGNISSFLLKLTNGGSATVTWFSGVEWGSGTAPPLTSSGVDILAFVTHDAGTTWSGSVFALDLS